MNRLVFLVSCWILLTGCGDGSGGQNSASCPDGLEPSGSACIPIFDDCTGPAEIPILGGGCQAVGVTTCATGLFEPDGEGGCEPILPDHSCHPGTMEVLGHTACQLVGVTQCADGFEADGEGGCNAVLPPGPDPCPPGTIVLLGHTTCQPLGDCGTGTWGNIVDDGTTVYVDHSADATGADGTQQAPFVTVGEALAAVQPGGQIAVAAGDYTERLNITKPVRLTGRCAAQVTLRGQWFLGLQVAPVTIRTGGSGTEVRGVTLTGPAEGLVVTGAQQVLLRELQVLSTTDLGIVLWEGAEVSVRRSVVADCGNVGVGAQGSTLSLEEVVVRNTLPMIGTQSMGHGVHAQCDPYSGVCGSLRISSSLVSGSRDAGIFANGTDMEIDATVVRGTLSDEESGRAGYGVCAACQDETGACAGLALSSSVVSGNRSAGVISFGGDIVIRDSTVRDTESMDGPGLRGAGIVAQCAAAGVCRNLEVSACFVSNNREVGILASGVNAEIHGTVVRDTRPEENDTTSGRGIIAQCDPEVGGCGTILISSCLVSRNRVMGIHLSGVVSEVVATVVRDNVPQESDGTDGWGIGARCSTSMPEACGRLRVSSSIVEGNREAGIFPNGVDTEITASIVRDTQPRESDLTGGRGINAQCDLETGICGSLLVSSSLVEGNREAGVFAGGLDAEVTETVVRDTLSEESTGEFGAGVGGECDASGECGRLRVSSSLVSGNRLGGILVFGMDLEVTTTVVRDTMAERDTGEFGRGINAECDHEVGACGSLSVSSSLVVRNENVGLYVAGVTATLQGVAVLDTLPNTEGPFQGIDGQGIWAVCDDDLGTCGALSITSCLLDSSQGAGVALEGVSGFLNTSSVRSVAARVLDGKYGYGVQIGGLEGEEMPAFSVNGCEIRDAKLAGILFYRARGTVGGSLVSGGENSVVMNEGSEPTILDDNELSGTVEDDPIWANLYPSPAPAPAVPLD